MSLIGSVFERKTVGNSNAKDFSGSSATGFPAAQHRSKSAFAQRRDARNAQKAQSATGPDAPKPVPMNKSVAQNDDMGQNEPSGDWRSQISQENERLVAAMSPEQVDSERKDILERFGEELLTKFKNARSRKVQIESKADSLDEVPITEEKPKIQMPFPAPPALSSPATPRATTPRNLRFAPLNPEDVHVYPSAPPSPRRKALALPPPSEDDTDAISIGSFNASNKYSSSRMDVDVDSPSSSKPGDADKSKRTQDEDSEGTPEFIRRRYFPSHPQNDPALEWMSPPTTSLSSAMETSPAKSPLSSFRFDLTGTPIPEDQADTLPTHLGLHHHADPSGRAGYTLEDIFLLSRSTVASQRIAMVDLLCGVAKWASKQSQSQEFEELRKRISSVGIVALSERSPSMITRAVDLIWSALGQWSTPPSPSVVDKDTTLPNLLLPLPSVLGRDDIPRETKTTVVHLLHSLLDQPAAATSIVHTPSLIPSLVQEFIISPEPYLSAISLMTTLTKHHRDLALELVSKHGVADALVRFLIEEHYLSDDVALIQETLRFYVVSGHYGMGANSVAGHPQVTLALARLGSWAFSSPLSSKDIQHLYLDLISTYLTCATDPHSTTPMHSITWSSIQGWDWADELHSLSQSAPSGLEVQAALLDAAAVYVEGASMNSSAQQRDKERVRFAEILRCDWVTANITSVLTDLESSSQMSAPDLAAPIDFLASYIRLFLGCHTSAADRNVIDKLFAIARRLASDDNMWIKPSQEHRPLTTFLYMATRLASALHSSQGAAALPLVVLPRFLPGDEDISLSILDVVLGQCSQHPTLQELGIHTSIVKPFWVFDIQPWSVKNSSRSAQKDEEDIEDHSEQSRCVAPYKPTPKSIKTCTTLLVPWQQVHSTSSDLSETQSNNASNPLPSSTAKDTLRRGLPLRPDWVLTPLDHLLRSGSSPVFGVKVSIQHQHNHGTRNAAHPEREELWNPTEKDIVRACLSVTSVLQDMYKLLTRDEVVLGCMKVFMLEDGVGTAAGQDEVFRDEVVGRLMNKLIDPFTLRHRSPTPADEASLARRRSQGMESIHPAFYTFYTSFLSLYDQVSFGHPLFSSLLLLPISMRCHVEYRQLFWSDYSHIVKNVSSVSELDIPVTAEEGIREWFHPLEEDHRVIGGQLRALYETGVRNGFLRSLALHHVAGCIWDDLWTTSVEGEEKQKRDGRSAQLLQAVFQRCGADTVAELVGYTGPAVGFFGTPSGKLTEQVKQSRIHRTTTLLGEPLATKVQEFLNK